MHRVLVLWLGCLLVTGCSSLGSQPATPPASVSTAAVGFQCSQSQWDHVYHPARFTVLSPCVTVAGVVDMVNREPDGDDHVLVHLDPGVRCDGGSCVNAMNASAELGDLVVEPVCEHTVTQADAISACAGYHNPIAVPEPGAHAVVSGPRVLDSQHGWLEVHPVERLDVR